MGFIRLGFARMRLWAVAGLCLAVAMTGRAQDSAGGSAAPARIGIYKENPHYWQYKGKPVLLLGGTRKDNAFQMADLIEQLDLLAAAGGNYIRNVMHARYGDEGNVYPFAKRQDGQYELRRFNPEYWRRFENCLREAAARDIIVQIELWDRFQFSNQGETETMRLWGANPYNPRNNANYTEEESGMREVIKTHPMKNANAFFHTVPALENNRVVLPHQEAFIDKLLSISLNYGNVLYCMDNETGEDPAWGDYWSMRIQAKAAEAGVEVHTTEMYDGMKLEHVVSSPDIYSFVEGSKIMGPRRQKWAPKNEEQWHQTLTTIGEMGERPRPINAVKIICNNPDPDLEIYSVRKFWRNVLAGFAGMRFHRWPGSLALEPEARVCIRAMRLLESEIKMWDSEPRLDLLSDRERDEAYLRCRPGRAYGLFFTNGGEVGLDLSDFPGPYRVRWIDIGAGDWAGEDEIQGGETARLAAPGAGPWAAAITIAAR